jgi:glycosyltransferase involved in cell wall biosynthesis
LNKLSDHKNLTIAIPFYNGLSKITHILDNLFTLNIVDYEVLIIDDCSASDQTNGLIELIDKKYKGGNLRYLRNHTNIGMDSNFQKCIFESLGKFIWFFGQDDYITLENLNYCNKKLIKYNPEIVFANYTIERTWKYKSKYIFNSNLKLSYGIGVIDFLKISNNKVPSFLPSLIIKKSAWPKEKVVSKFYGTHFIQLASFLYNLFLDKNWLYIGKPMAVGAIPATGWQHSISERVKYYFGFVSCLDKLLKLNFPNSKLLIDKQLSSTKTQHILLSIESKILKRNDLLDNLMNSNIFPFTNRFLSKLVFHTPTIFLSFLQTLRSIYYNLKN